MYPDGRPMAGTRGGTREVVARPMAAPAQLPRPLPLAQRSVSVLIAALAVVWPGVGLVLPVSPALGVALIPLALGSVTASLLTTSGRPGVPAAGRRFWRQLSVAGAFAGVAHVPWAYRVVRNGGADGVC